MLNFNTRIMKDIVYIKGGKRYRIYKVEDKGQSIIYYEVGKSDCKIICSIDFWTANFEREPEPEPLGFWEVRARVRELTLMDNKPYEEVHASY